MARDWRTAPLERVDRALCELAAKLTLDQDAMTPEDLDRLRGLAWTTGPSTTRSR